MLFLFLVVLAVGTVFLLQNRLSSQARYDTYNFYGTELAFRGDLRSAQNISVYPNETAVFGAVWNPYRQHVTIAFINSTYNNITAVGATEITLKLKTAYLKFDWDVGFTGREVNSYDNLKGDDFDLVIALIPPSVANQTGVEVKNNVIYIQGKTFEDFDKATLKFIMAALNITV